MTLTRITSTLGAMALGGVLVASTYGAQAAGPSVVPARAPHHGVARDAGFVAPMPHKYGANGMRMGMHCETTDPS
jgi:hypothetical protein